MVTHACNLRCTYCYGGAKTSRSMPLEMGRKAIERGVASVEKGGILELGFFGGEPLLEPDLILALAETARYKMQRAGLRLAMVLTTNATVADGPAWSVMTMPELHLALSIDGRAETHDRVRRFPSGRGSSELALNTLKRLLAVGKAVKISAVVTPSGVETVPEEVIFLREQGVRDIELSLDLWSQWDMDSVKRLEKTIVCLGRLWMEGLPDYHLNWFDDKAARLAQPGQISACRCGFGKGDIAVTPAGNLYPCERLIGEDRSDNPMRLNGTIYDREDFLFGPAGEVRNAGACMGCGIEPVCNTTCGCCNYVRTGKIGEPDGFLCLFNQWCLREAQNILKQIVVPSTEAKE